MAEKKQGQFKNPSAEVRDKGLEILKELLADLAEKDTDSLDKAFVAKAMLSFENLKDSLSGETDEEVVNLVAMSAKVFEDLMMDNLTPSDELLDLSRACTGWLKDFLEGGSGEGFESIESGLKSLWGEEEASPVQEEKAESAPKPAPEKKTEPEEDLSGSYPLPIHSEDDAVIYVEFISETTEHIDNIESGILELEKNPENMDLLNSIFRHFHSVKGAAGFLGILDVSKVSHETENLLDLARKGMLYVDHPIVNLLLKSTDCQVRLLRHIDSRIQHLLGKIPEKDIEPSYDIVELVGQLRGVIAEAKARPAAPRVEKPPTAPGIAPPEERIEPGARKITAVADVKVSTDKLDLLMEMVGELVISQALVSQDSSLQNEHNVNIQKNLAIMGKITKNLQEQVLAVRMVPLRMLFQKMARLVRDLGAKQNKKIKFEISGEDTEIDKTVIDGINDPLVHLLRNSADHGIESQEERKEMGKSETARVSLKAYNQSGNVVIEVVDDGKGLDRDKIRKKAIDRGLVKEDKQVTDREIYEFILQAGFSTADRITDVSGRGVGMDVVVRNIQKLNGKLEIDSEKGKGSTFTIRLPLTMAIIDGMVVQVGQQRYIIPIVSIKESVQPTQKDITSVTEGGEVVDVRGKLIPLIRLNKLFQIPDSKTDPCEALFMIVESNGKERGLMVDNLIGQHQVVIKNLGPRLQGVKGVSGGAILGDGRVGLILDVEGIIESI